MSASGRNDPDGGRRLPSGTVSFLFADIEGATRRWEIHGADMGRCVVDHDRVLREAVRLSGGVVVKGTGDGMMAVFDHADAALAAALAGQAGLAAQDWAPVPAIRVRMGIHQGRAEPLDGDYFGVVVNRAARVADAGHGGQVLVSAAAAATMTPPASVHLVSRGTHQLKDLAEPVELFQVLGPSTENELLRLRTIDADKNRLPTQRTAFIGRRQELAHAAQYLAEGRLLTLCGPGGVGKTRLAIQVAAETAARFINGVRFVDLSHANLSENLESIIRDQLRAGRQDLTRPEPARETVLRLLGEQDVLLVLDNCEQVVEEAARVIGWLVDAAPGVRVLSTSREALRIAGEQVFRLEPFEQGPPQRTATASATGLLDPAVELFIDRARGAGGPTPTADQLPTVARICDLVDRLPLGIELAAARTAQLSVEELLRRLEGHYDVLASRERDRTHRHRTIDELLDWSYALLDEQERRLFARLGVFTGPIGLDVIELVCGGDAVGNEDVVDVLISLVDRSLVVHDPERAVYRMLSLVGRFARDLLARSDESETVQDRYWAWCAAVGTDAADDDDRLSQVASQVGQEVSAGLNSAIAAGRAEPAWAIASWFWRVYEMRGQLREGVVVLERALALDPKKPQISGAITAPANATVAYARVCNGLAGLMVANGEAQRAAPLHRRAADIFTAAEDRHGVGWALTGLSMALLHDDAADTVAAAQAAEDAVTIFDGLGERRGLGHAHSARGLVAAKQGLLDEAEFSYLKALSAFRLGRHRRDAMAVLSNLGNLAYDRGDLLRAARFFDGARQLSIELDDTRGTGFIVNNLCLVAQERGDLSRSLALAQAALDCFRRVGEAQGTAVALLHQANVLAQQDQRAAALSAYRDAVETFRQARDARGVLMGLTNLSRIAWAWGARSLAWRCEVDRATVSFRLGLSHGLAESVNTLIARTDQLGDHDLANRLRRDLILGGADLEQTLSEARLAGPTDEGVTAQSGMLNPVAATTAAPINDLTNRERELLRLLGNGRTNEELAAELYISRRTVDAHLSHIRTKLGVADRVKLAVLARQHIDPDDSVTTPPN